MFSLLAQASEIGVTAAVVGVVVALVSGGISTLTKRAMSASEGRITDKIDRVEKDVTELRGDLKIMKQETDRQNSGLHKRVTDLAVDQREAKAKLDAHLDETRHGKSKG